MSKIFNFKSSIWETITVADHLEDRVSSLICNGIIQSREDLESFLESVSEEASIYHTNEDEPLKQMDVSENGGYHTIEVIHGTEMIWNNSLPIKTDSYRVCILDKETDGLSEESIYGTEEQALYSAYKHIMASDFRAPNSDDTVSNYIDEYYEYISTTLDGETDYNISVRYLNINL